MKKKLLLRGALGFPIGIAIGYVITICISLVWAGGYYSPCVPELAEALGSEIGAVALQALLCGLLGAGFAASSVIWEMESWSIARQTGVYFFIISLIKEINPSTKTIFINIHIAKNRPKFLIRFFKSVLLFFGCLN